MRRSTSGQARPALVRISTSLVGIAREVARLEMRHRQERARLGHPVACEHIDAAVHRLLGERLRQRRAADHHLQAGEIDIGLRGRIEQHLQDRWHAMGERHALGLDQLDQQRRIVTARIDLLDAGKRRRPREAPRVNMEHRRDRHIDVVAMEAALLRRKAKHGEFRHCMQHQLAVAVVDAFRQPGGSRRVEGRRLDVLVEVREVKVRTMRPRAAARIRRRIRVCRSPALCGR